MAHQDYHPLYCVTETVFGQVIRTLKEAGRQLPNICFILISATSPKCVQTWAIQTATIQFNPQIRWLISTQCRHFLQDHYRVLITIVSLHWEPFSPSVINDKKIYSREIPLTWQGCLTLVVVDIFIFCLWFRVFNIKGTKSNFLKQLLIKVLVQNTKRLYKTQLHLVHVALDFGS